MKDQVADANKAEVSLLADQASECISLVATNILSLRHWHYLKVESGDDAELLSWFSPDWLKMQALDFAMNYVKLAKKNDKFLNQLLSLAVYEYASMPQMSENLLNVSLMYHTLSKTEQEEKKKDRVEGSKEPF